MSSHNLPLVQFEWSAGPKRFAFFYDHLQTGTGIAVIVTAVDSMSIMYLSIVLTESRDFLCCVVFNL